MQQNSLQPATAVPSSATPVPPAAPGKENVGSGPAASKTIATKPRGVGPRSGLKNNPPKIAAIPPPTAVAPTTKKSPAPITTRPAAGRSSSRINKAVAPAVRASGRGRIPVSTRLEPTGTADPKPKKQQQRLQNLKPAESAEPLLPRRRGPLFRVSNGSGSSSGGGGGEGGEDHGCGRSGGGRKRKSIAMGSGGVQAGQPKRRQRGVLGKNGQKGKGGKRQPKPIKTTAESNAEEHSHLSCAHGRSDFDFDLYDDTAVSDSHAKTSLGAEDQVPPRRPAGKAATTAAAGKKKARGGGAGGKSTPGKPTRSASDGSRRERGGPSGWSSLGAGEALSSPRSMSNARSSSGSEVGLSPRGSWHLSTLFGDTDDEADDDTNTGGPAECNWRLSDDEVEESGGGGGATSRAKRSPRRSVGNGGAAGAAASGKSRRVSGSGRGNDAGGRSGGVSGGRPGRGKSLSAGESGGGGGSDDGAETAQTGWADGLPPPASGDSGGEDENQSTEEKRELEAILARFKKVDSHRLEISH